MANIREAYESIDNYEERQEKKLIIQLQKEYGLTYREARKIIYEFGDKVTKDGKIDSAEANKYKRKDNLIRDVLLLVSLNNSTVRRLTDGFLKSNFRNNLNYSQYLLEKTTGVNNLVQTFDITNDILHTPVDIEASRIANANVKNDIRRNIIAGIQQGQTPREMSLKVKQTLEKDARKKINIEQNERARAENEARFTAMEQAEKKGAEVFKTWNAKLDRKTRDSHAELDGDTIPYNEEFDNGLMYPHDPSGEPEETINCRCSLETFGDADVETFNEWREN